MLDILDNLNAARHADLLSRNTGWGAVKTAHPEDRNNTAAEKMQRFR